MSESIKHESLFLNKCKQFWNHKTQQMIEGLIAWNMTALNLT
jgi:hypothetical protein